MEDLTDDEKICLITVLVHGMSPLINIAKGRFFKDVFEEILLSALEKIGINNEELDRLLKDINNVDRLTNSLLYKR